MEPKASSPSNWTSFSLRTSDRKKDKIDDKNVVFLCSAQIPVAPFMDILMHSLEVMLMIANVAATKASLNGRREKKWFLHKKVRKSRSVKNEGKT